MPQNQSSEKNNLLLVNYEGGSGFPSSDGPSQLATYTPRELFAPTLSDLENNFNTVYLEPHSRAELISQVDGAWQIGTTVLSTDHSVTYPVIKAIKKRGTTIDAVIVVDQHKDIYGYKTHGSLLSKANPFRILIDEGLIKGVIFVGSRLREEAFLRPFSRGLGFEDRYYALLRYFQKTHSGLRGKVFSIPATETNSLLEGLTRATELAKKMGYGSLGLDIDLDAFDSLAIPGVDYGPNLPVRIRKEFDEKLSRAHGLKRLALLSRWHTEDRIVMNYIKHKIEDAGLATPSTEELASIHALLAEIKPHYFHLTEFKPEFDENGQSAPLVEALIRTCSR